MAQNINDTVVTNLIDHMTAVTKSLVASYTTVEEEDMFQIIVREQNPDDLSTGVTFAEAIDDSLAAGTSYSSIWISLLSWLNTRATVAGSTDLNLLLAARKLRVPHTFNQYIYNSINGSDISSSNVFPDQYWDGTAWTTYALGAFAHGSTFAVGTTLPPTTVSAMWAQATATVAGPGSWVVEADVTYTDGSVGVETVTFAAGGPTVYDIGAQVLIACGAAPGTVSLAGGDRVYINTPVGFVAGQEVLVWTGQYHALLTQDYEGSSVGASAQVYISPLDAGCFNPGDSLTIDHEAAAAAGAANIILDINYETGLITFRANLPATDFLMSANAHIYKTTPDSVGNCEIHTVHSVVTGAAGYVRLTANLQHTYVGTGCKCIRLIASLDDVATNSGGAGGDTSTYAPVVERTISQGNII